MHIRALVSNVNRIVADATIMQYVTQPNACPFRTANGSGRPLVAACRRVKFRTPVAAALELQLQRVMIKTGPEIRQGQFLRFYAGLTRYFNHPVIRVDAGKIRRYAVIPNEQPFDRRHLVVQEMCRRFGVDRPVVQDDEPCFTFKLEWRIRVGKCRRDEAARHMLGERYGGPDRSGHHCQSAAPQKAAARYGVWAASP